MSTIPWRNHILKSAYIDSGIDYYIGLSKTLPDEFGGSISEPVGGNYMRVPFGGISEPSVGSISNTSPITFPQSSEEWFPPSEPAQCWVLFDGDSVESNVLTHGVFDKAYVVSKNMVLSIPAGSVCISVIDKE